MGRTHYLSCLVCIILTISVSCGQVQEMKYAADIDRINDLITANYVFPDVAEKTAQHLQQRLEEGAFASITSYDELAEKLTAEVQSVNHDKHMRITAINRPGFSMPSGLNRETDGGFGKMEILDGNIGYIEMFGFFNVKEGAPVADRIMKEMEQTVAIIIDLRKNGGGSPEMVQYLCSYFFDEKIHLNSLYWRRGDHIQEFWTLEEINGKKRPDVPLYILTSSYTFSGAEEFCYNMKTRNRATIIGEVTGGGANPGEVMRINDELRIFIPTGRAINPVTKTNWEGTGVQPDVEISSDEALEKALDLITK